MSILRLRRSHLALKYEKSVTKLASHRSLALLWVVFLLVEWRPLVNTLALALRDDEYTHVLLIFPISATLIFLEWRSLRPMFAPNVRIGCLLLAMAGFVFRFFRGLSCFLTFHTPLSIMVFSLVLSWIGAFILCSGSRVSRSLLFPLCFLFWLVPFPQAVLNEIVSLLQQGSALTAHVLFAAVGVPVAKDGVLLTIPGLTVEVAKECSSIRSSLMLVVCSMVLAHLFLRSGWGKVLVVLVAIPLSVAKNGLRIFTIAMLGPRVDPGFLDGRFHRNGGILFFLLSLAGLLVLLWLVGWAEGKTTTQAGSARECTTAPHPHLSSHVGY